MEKSAAILVRMSPDEKNIINSKAQSKGMTTGKYMRTVALSGKYVDYSELRNLNVELKRIGTNINQAVKLMNIYKEFDVGDYNSLAEQIAEVVKLVNQSMKR